MLSDKGPIDPPIVDRKSGAGRGRRVCLGLLVADWTGGRLLGFLSHDPSVGGIPAIPTLRVFLFALGRFPVVDRTCSSGWRPAIQGTRATTGGHAPRIRPVAWWAASVIYGFSKGLVITQVALSLVLLMRLSRPLRAACTMSRISTLACGPTT